ncbi:hypothetical protein [Arthrobacter sp. CJ23]|uniref:hypothetical protein n=1 Tax=Arthrobacter sp. CJ23 TaxID=2972479 RepID=UPI00215C7C97|nr:hypothetical protein [Arthrobacter sp. CJ23]UVJ40114.1 hypothetical protein NVV90_02670 [Arthrobacter sp. CJ23]
MDSIPDADVGSWLCSLLDTTWRDMHVVVPHGFEAYARVFHPAYRDRPADTGSWHGQERPVYVDIEQESVSWAEVARAFGATMHPLAQYQELPGPENGPYREVLDAAGWRYAAPVQGNLDVEVLASLAKQLCRHTATPDRGVAAVWEGWGGLTSSAGYSQPTFVEGVAAAGPGTFALDAPWHHDPWWPQSPSLLWPEDRSWVLVTEVDFDSTIIAGSSALVAALVSDSGIEALRIDEGSRLSI